MKGLDPGSRIFLGKMISKIPGQPLDGGCGDEGMDSKKIQKGLEIHVYPFSHNHGSGEWGPGR